MPKKAAIAGQIANRDEMAGILGISVTTLDRYVRAGCPVVERAENRREYRFNSADVIAWREEREAQAKAASPAADDVRRRYTLAAAQLKELELAERRGLMVSVEDILPTLVDQLANVRSRLMAMPGRLAIELAALSDPVAIERVMTNELAAALSELTTDR
jgi:phage terminase Nu1 subunit (DNA packaging protein)